MNVHEIIEECQEEHEYLGTDVARIVYLALTAGNLGYREYEILAKIFLALGGTGGRDDYSAQRDYAVLLEALESLGFCENTQ